MLGVLILLMGSSFAWAQVATHPSTVAVPATIPAPAPAIASTTMPATSPAQLPLPMMSREFSILTQRSIFLKGRQHVEDTRTRSYSEGSTTREGAESEHTIVFNGATDADNDLVAYLEDTTTGRISKVRVGDTVAQGKITRITLDNMDYEAHGRVIEVLIGHNLEGGLAFATTEPVAGEPGAGDSGAGPSTTPASAGSGVDAVLEQMRQRRKKLMGE